MSDTIIFGKRFTGALKAGLIYVFIDISLGFFQGFGQALYELNPAEWQQWWTPKKVAWCMIQFGAILTSAAVLLKAYYSNSSKPPQQ